MVSSRLLFPALALTVPGMFAATGMLVVDAPGYAVVFGLGLVGAIGVMLAAVRSSQRTAGFPMLMALAIIAVVPDLSVESIFAWSALSAPDSIDGSLVMASLTGSSRLLFGVAWPLIIVGYWARRRSLTLDADQHVGLSFVFLAALYGFVIFVRGYMWPLDTPVLLLLFMTYVWRMTRPGGNVDVALESGETGSSPVRRSGAVAYAVFGYGAVAAFVISGLFVRSLLAWSVADQFGMLQLYASLASKVPFVAAVGVLAWRGNLSLAVTSLGASAVGLLTLVLATLPLVVMVGGVTQGNLDIVAFDDRQRVELLLMASHAVYAVVIISGRSLSLRTALVLFAPFAFEWVMSSLQPMQGSNLAQGLFSVIYLTGAALAIAADRSRLHALGGIAAPIRRVKVLSEQLERPVS